MSYTTYLAHHGIKGQKWGVRRFQNEDGTLTKAGLKRAGYKFKTIRKNATTSRILIDENEDTSKLDRAYFSTNNLDNQKWANYFASIGAQHLDKSAYAVNFKAKKKLIIARGEEISKVASKLMDKDDTFRKEFEATRQKQIQSTGSEEAWDSLSESAKYSAMIAYKCEGGKKIISAMKDIGFDGVEDLFGKDVSKDPIIIFNPGSNLRQVGQKQELKGLYRGYRKYYGLPINHSYFSCHNISDNAGGSNQMFMNDDLLAYGAYLEHHGIKGQKWGVRRFQKADGSLTAAGAKRYGIKGAMSAGRKVGSGLVKAARGGIQKAKEAKARKAAEKLERQKKVWAKTRLGLTMNADKFTVEELREANNRLDERDRAAKGFAEQVKRGVGYFQAIRDVTGAIKDTKDYIEDISGEKERKQKAADELKYQRQLEKEERDHQRALEKDKLSAERDIDYKREKDQLDRESRERISKYTVDAKNKKDDSDKSSTSTKPNDPDGPNNGGGSDKISYKGYEFDREFLKKTNPEVYKAATDAEASRERQEAAQKRALDRVVKETESSTVNRESKSDESPKPTKSDKAESNNNVDQHRVEKYREFAKNIDASDLSADDKVKYKKSFYSKVKAFKGDTEEFNLETERTLDIAKGLKKSADNRKAAEARQKAEAEANREETTEERQKRKVAEATAYGAEAQYQANRAQLESMSDSQLARMAVRRKASEVVDTVKSFNPKAMAEKYLASGERERLEKESRKIAEMSTKDLGARYAEMVRRQGQEAADYAITEYTENARRQSESSSRDKAFVGKTYTPDTKRMNKDRQALNNKKAQDQIDKNVAEVEKLKKQAADLDRLRGEGGGDRYRKQIRELEDENRKLRNGIKHSDLSVYGNYLAHHGIKGQKWGVRRFQNEDGTLTKAGLRRNEKAEKFREKELKRYDKNINRAIARGNKNTKQMYEALADHLVKMTVDDIYKEHRAVRTKAIGKAVLAGVATTLASSFAGLPNIASIPMGVAMGKAASAGTRDKYRLEQIAHAVIFADDNALEHHGIKGQKWGIRRFQDEAGRLTSAGKKHAAELRDKVTSKLKINAKSMEFEAQGGGGGGSIDGWEDVSEEDEITLNDQKDSLVLFLDRGMMSDDEVKELADAFGYEFDDSLPKDVQLRRLTETIQKTKGSDLKEAMYNFQQTQRKKVSYSEGIANGVSAVVNALFSSNLAAVADPVVFVKDVISAEMAKSKVEKRKQSEPVDEETGLHLKQNTDASREEDLKDVNPGWKNLATNTKHNCMCCTATYDMRRRGYDVTANEVQFGYDYGDVTRWYPDAEVKAVDTTKADKKYSTNYNSAQYKQAVNEQLQKELVAQGDGARGNLMVSWDGGGGHSMAYEVVNGVAYVYDGQANMKMNTSDVVAMAHDIQYARLDNVDFDPEKIKEVVH